MPAIQLLALEAIYDEDFSFFEPEGMDAFILLKIWCEGDQDVHELLRFVRPASAHACYQIS